MRIAVVGAGVVGLTSAVAIKEAFPNAFVTVFSEDFSPNTTGDGSAGLWGPFALGNSSTEKILKWAGRTHKWMETFWKSDLAAEVGVSLLPVVRVYNEKSIHEFALKWVQLVYGGMELDEKYLEQFNADYKKKFRYGLHFVTYTCEVKKLLPWLMNKFVLLGGQVEQRFIKSFNDLQNENFDLIINCSGLGASLLANDSSVLPIRGQVIRVEAPWIYEVILEECSDGNYIIPNLNSVVLGGTCQKGDYDTSVREIDSRFIHEGCSRIFPALQKSATINKWTGLRPGRPGVRLEADKHNFPDGKHVVVIHNYGHGGSGVTLCWGCALDVIDILRQTKNNIKSHL